MSLVFHWTHRKAITSFGGTSQQVNPSQLTCKEAWINFSIRQKQDLAAEGSLGGGQSSLIEQSPWGEAAQETPQAGHRPLRLRNPVQEAVTGERCVHISCFSQNNQRHKLSLSLMTSCCWLAPHSCDRTPVSYAAHFWDFHSITSNPKKQS